MTKGSVVYCITNKVTKNQYIGQSTNFKYRIYKHFHLMKHRKHPSQLMNTDYLSYGKDSFDINILECCDKEELLNTERKYIQLMKPVYNSEVFRYPIRIQLSKLKTWKRMLTHGDIQTLSNKSMENLGYNVSRQTISKAIKVGKYTAELFNYIDGFFKERERMVLS